MVFFFSPWPFSPSPPNPKSLSGLSNPVGFFSRPSQRLFHGLVPVLLSFSVAVRSALSPGCLNRPSFFLFAIALFLPSPFLSIASPCTNRLSPVEPIEFAVYKNQCWFFPPPRFSSPPIFVMLFFAVSLVHFRARLYCHNPPPHCSSPPPRPGYFHLMGWLVCHLPFYLRPGQMALFVLAFFGSFTEAALRPSLFVFGEFFFCALTLVAQHSPKALSDTQEREVPLSFLLPVLVVVSFSFPRGIQGERFTLFSPSC